MTAFEFEKKFFEILDDELVPALGCTEPISVAYAAAKAREVLGEMPDKIMIRCSGGLIKNISCVYVPNTNNMVGIEASILAGMVGGDSSRKMEVLSTLKKSHIPKIKALHAQHIVHVSYLDTPLNLHFILRVEKGSSSCEIEIKNLHTNIIRITKNDESVFELDDVVEKYFGVMSDRKSLTVDRIYA
ncbi:MAG: serine dehydratase subunit alpha family protein, partial [Acholeplasmataceae bacterium]|nr:serine dehydratase subunit alpha family protein [Acholeplasmataceae bacterium]